MLPKLRDMYYTDSETPAYDKPSGTLGPTLAVAPAFGCTGAFSWHGIYSESVT